MTDKGKGKAIDVGERAPLLGSSSRASITAYATEEPLDERRNPSRFRSILLTCLLVLASLAISAILFFALLAYSFRPSPSELSALPRTAFRYSPPEDIKVLDVTDDGILVNVSLRCGIMVDRALGLRGLDDDRRDDGRGGGAEWWEGVRRWTAHRMLAQLPVQAAKVEIDDPIHIIPHQLPTLLSVALQTPLLVPFITDFSPDSPLVSFMALAKPIASTGQLWEYVQRAWEEGEMRVVVNVDRVKVELPGEKAWWGKYARAEKEDLALRVNMPVPHLPGLPSPGRPFNLSSIVSLREYSFHTSASSISISALATMPNFLPQLNMTLPFSLPFEISLPPDTRMARVVTAPVQLSGPYVQLKMSGQVTADLHDEAPLSMFLRNYLHGTDNPIIVRGLSTLPTNVSRPPRWLLETLPSLSLPLTFPGPDLPPKIIQSVTIEHMRISESQSKVHASGVVVAEIELPPGMQGVKVDVIAVLPDVLVFDGPAPLNGEESRAFGRIHPDDFLPSSTSPSSHPLRLTVRAPLKDVELQVLRGKDGVLSDFVTKVIFKGGAQAGVKGTASVRVRVVGVDGTVRLEDLPVSGDFWVGRAH